MDLKVRNLLQLAFLILLCLPAVKILYDSYHGGSGFLSTIHFSHRLSRQLDPELRELIRPVSGPIGYDGQFYAVMALCPDLRCEGMGNRSDAPSYRFRRIGLPFMAWIGAGGRPAVALHLYAVINMLFWLGLLLLLYRYTGFRNSRDRLLAISLLWSAGTLISLERALTDLPAVVLSSWVAFGWMSRSGSTMVMALALLVKETSLLSLPAMTKGANLMQTLRDRWNWVMAVLVVVPWVLWLGWVFAQFPGGDPTGRNNFGLPLVGIWECALNAFSWQGRSLLHERIHLLLTLAALFSLLVQSAYLLVRPRTMDPFWRMGVAFGLLFLVLGSNVMEDYHAYLRVVLPLTFAFNFLLHRHENGTDFVVLLALGNLGMMGVALNEWLGVFGHSIV